MSADPFAVAADLIDPQGAGHFVLQPKQELAERLANEVDELLYGGAAFGGKTAWGLEHVISECDRCPNNRGLVLRRVWPSLQRDVLPRVKDALAGRAQWNGQTKTFVFPNGSVLELGHLQHPDSWRRYQGTSYGVIFFEELTEFLEPQYESLRAWNRVPPMSRGVRPHTISTTNPGGIGHRWVKQRFIAPPHVEVVPGVPWQPEPTDEVPRPPTRVFVSARAEDNPAGVSKDPEYMERLRGAISNRALRKALETGDWHAIDAVEDALWKQSWLDDGRVRPGHLEDIKATRRAVAIDPSDGTESGDRYGMWAGGRGLDGVCYTTYAVGLRGSPRRLAESTIEMYYDLRADAIVVERNHGGRWLTSLFEELDPYVNVATVWASEGKRTRAEPIAALFEPKPGHVMPYRARLEGHHSELEEELTTFAGKPNEPSPDVLDALVWGHRYLLDAEDVIGGMWQAV